ncbi:MAG TPA: hypothetical protein DCP91_08155 [Eggerthellaceae bacterium]|nr:hypothetical protein [Eggerthellaceae bacterium]
MLKSGDFFRRVAVTRGDALPHANEKGISCVGIIPFLLGETIVGWASVDWPTRPGFRPAIALRARRAEPCPD